MNIYDYLRGVDNYPKNDYDPHLNYKGEVHTKQEYIDWRFSLGFGNLYDEDFPKPVIDISSGYIKGYVPAGPEGYIDEMFTIEEWHDFHKKLHQKINEDLNNFNI